jgi:phosphate-selective porin
MQSEVAADQETGVDAPLPKGAPGETATGFTFWNRPYVNGTRRRLGSDLAYSRGPLKVQAEYLEIREQRKGQGVTGLDIPDVRGRGWNAQVSYVLTGESKGSTVTPKTSLFKGGRGALELVFRVEALKFDDTGAPSSSSSFGNRASDISPSGSSAIQAGANYWASNFMKIQGSALWESYHDPRIAPVPGDQGRYFTLIARIQFMIP